MAVDFCSISSGSGGNCIFISSGETKILIDAGISGARIKDGLSKINCDPEKISAIFITHEHKDHISGVGIYSRRYNVPIYANQKTWAEMEKSIGKISTENTKIIHNNEHNNINEVTLINFPINHDAADPVGYSVIAEGIKITVATDIGIASDHVKNAISDSEIVLIESNHDEHMLKTGRYPYYLKKRILGDYGHLSNKNAAELLVSSLTKKTRHVFLGHLSKENNTPEIAYNFVLEHLKNNDIMADGSIKLHMAERDKVSLFVRAGGLSGVL